MNSAISSGDVIGGRYEIKNYIGEGGMQYVYLALDIVLQRYVALKTPKNLSAEKRFHRSAVVAARVNHPNVAKTFDYFEINGKPYLIEEYIDGSDLEKALLQVYVYVDPYFSARIFHYLAKALAASHHAGVVHRDLKPTNIMVGGGFEAKSVKITDFGIAKMAGEELAEAAEGGDESISNSQTALGALPYMAPECIHSPRDVGQAADIWSIGAMLYRIVTGGRPFGVGYKAIPKILEAKTPDFPGFLTANPQFKPLSQELINLIVRCLSKDPADRPTADQLVDACGSLCYPVDKRIKGEIDTVYYNSYGFIRPELGSNIFFHYDSVYGERPRVGDSVALSPYLGFGADRAHPVVKILSS